MLSHSIGLGTELFGGAYKFLSELGPCGWTQGLFFYKKYRLSQKKLPAKTPAGLLRLFPLLLILPHIKRTNKGFNRPRPR